MSKLKQWATWKSLLRKIFFIYVGWSLICLLAALINSIGGGRPVNWNIVLFACVLIPSLVLMFASVSIMTFFTCATIFEFIEEVFKGFR